MNNRSKYNTRQRKLLLDYLGSVPGVHITASDVCEYFKEQGASIGQSTIYRHLESLVDEGVINKYIIDANTPACFEYVRPEQHSDHDPCFHCKCEECGELIHLHCDELEDIMVHIRKDHSFRVNPARTVFYGLCDKCLKKAE